MNIINVMNVRILGASLLLSVSTAYANNDQTMLHQNHGEKAPDNSVPYDPPSSHTDHESEHGGQIHQSTEIETKWLKEDGVGIFHSQLESRIGTDENKLFVQINTEKAESEKTAYDVKAMYSRAFSDFWDVQVGVRHFRHTERQAQKEQTYFAVGLNGLAPYFFDTDIYLYAGKDKQYSMTLETDRDFLITQKLIAQPYLHSEIVFSDHSKYAKRSGLNHVSVGLETRYEITKHVMPFIEVGYKYERGHKETAWQEGETYSHGWLYGAGVQFQF